MVHVPAVGEEQQVAREQLLEGHLHAHLALIVSRARQLDVEHLAVAVLHQTRAVETGRRRAAPQIRHAEERVRAGGQIVQRAGLAHRQGLARGDERIEALEALGVDGILVLLHRRVRRGHGGLLQIHRHVVELLGRRHLVAPLGERLLVLARAGDVVAVLGHERLVFHLVGHRIEILVQPRDLVLHRQHEGVGQLVGQRHVETGEIVGLDEILQLL